MRKIYEAFAFLVVCSVFFLDTINANATTLQQLGVQKTEEGFRTIFFLKGELPEKVNTKTRPTVRVQFTKFEVLPSIKPDEILTTSIIKEVKFKTGKKGTITITIADPKAHVEYIVLPTIPPKPGTYRLIFDIIPSGYVIPVEEPTSLKTKQEEKIKPEENVVSERQWKVKTVQKEATTKAAEIEAIPFDEYIFREAEAAFQRRYFNKALVLYNSYLQRNKLAHRKQVLLHRAMAYYELHKEEWHKYGFEMIQLFEEALKETGNISEVARIQCIIASLYRRLGVVNRAEKIINTLMSKSLPSEVLGCIWKEIGLIKLAKQQPVEAISSLYKALSQQITTGERAEIHYTIGKILVETGAYKEALYHLNNAMELEPTIYQKTPDIIKQIGTALFGMRKFKSAQRMLIWYLNLKPDSKEKDLLWAQIAECFYQQNKLKLAERLQNHVMVEMPDTEGAYIIMLRRAQMLEQKEKSGIFQAEMVYEELSKKSLPLPLREITYFRWAVLNVREGKLEKALKIVNNYISTTPKNMPLDNFLELRSNILAQIIINFRLKEKYQQIVKLYEQYQNDVPKTSSVIKALAESYEALGSPDRAISFYKELLNSSGQNSEAILLKLAKLSFELRDLDGSLSYLNQLKSDAFLKEKLLLLVKIKREQNDWKGVLTSLNKLLAKDNSYLKDKNLTLLYLEALIKNERCNRAMEFAKQAIQNIAGLTKKEQLEIYKARMQCAIHLKKLNEAIAAAHKAIETADEEDVRCGLLYQLSKLYKQQGKTKDVELCLQKLALCKSELWKRFAEQELSFMKLNRRTEQQ